MPTYHIQNVTFHGSFPSLRIAPQFDLPEFAFIGRSNVGKSSLINYICNRKKLAKTSSTPGKTQFINLFGVEQKWILADLPGYGYAKVSQKKRQKWSEMIEDYLLHRTNLYCVFVLIDSRIPPQNIDIDMINWLGGHQVPFAIVFTKTDKPKPQALDRNIVSFFAALREQWDTMPPHFVTSSVKGRGREELIEYINEIITAS